MRFFKISDFEKPHDGSKTRKNFGTASILSRGE
jgi:hypothetical protein